MRLDEVLGRYQGLERKANARVNGGPRVVNDLVLNQRLAAGGEAMAVVIAMGEAANDNQEARVSKTNWELYGLNAFGKEAEFLKWAIYKLKSITGIDVSAVEVTNDLPQGVLGQYDIKSKKINIHECLLGQHALLMHVLFHEALHATVRKCDSDPNLDRDLEEGLVETVATKLAEKYGEGDGRSIAYAAERNTAATVAGMAGITWEEIQRALLSGDNDGRLVELDAFAAAA